MFQLNTQGGGGPLTKRDIVWYVTKGVGSIVMFGQLVYAHLQDKTKNHKKKTENSWWGHCAVILEKELFPTVVRVDIPFSP